MRLPGRDGTENSRALNGVVCPWRKRGVQSLGVPSGEQRSVSLIGGPDFDCVSVTLWPCPLLMESGGYSSPGDCSLENVEAEFQHLPMDSRRNPFSVFHSPRRA